MLPDLIEACAGELSRTDRRIADHLLEHMEDVPFLRAAEIAERLGVSAASVTRFAQRLGFDGYPRLQDAVRADLRSVLAPPRVPAGEDGSRYARVWDREMRNLEALRELPDDVLDGAARMIAEAGTVWVLGGRASESAAAALAFSLARVRDGVRSVDSSALHDYQPLLDLGPSDLLVALTFRRYTRSTAQIGRMFATRGVPILLITDDGSPSLAHDAKLVLRVSGRAPGGLPSMTAATSLGLALTLGVVGHVGSERLDAGERLSRDMEIFEG
ncbi:MurR/RpiR family transcriptional regulator [Streptomyces sp. TS71-3]|uniref:MurR/RpiR family transcriptional regulator n=1 Tax=Streptomyces sp. TS71-3 TaxID=2733862 RepID=UPI001B284AAD|nr:MurR/RpiR family transcriptional regulator [Streptomyces sp. TS71-3]GHJ36824.1 RpiR family transcriptional regulator [Streptomyces sp. TS71-3]